ncbi:hypothetical protein D6T51_18290 [Salmonella enterica subsp. enterica serovar Muenchen]|nr:hypothetical protein [Salmonella enterica subsp. enterica serovar Muenchen]
MNTITEHRDCTGLLTEDTTERIDRLKNTLSLMESLFDAKKEMRGDPNVTAKEMVSFFSSLLEEVRRIQSEIHEPGGIFSVSEVINGLKYIRNKS